MNGRGWSLGEVGIVTREVNFLKDSIVFLKRDGGSDCPWWGLVKGGYTQPYLKDNRNGNREDCASYCGIKKLTGYFRDISSPTQQEIDMFNMLYGTELTREDLCQE